MAKNIIICSDGTGNTAIKNRGTNVYKLFEAVDLHGHRHGHGVRQIAFYDDGVGSQGWAPLQKLKGAFGWGLSHNVKALYADLVRAYEPGDKIFLFGFSRGAFTVRSLAGFIGSCGILPYAGRHNIWRDVREAYNLYRKRYRTRLYDLLFPPYDDAPVKKFFESKGSQPAPIEFIGVWDTVDAVGLPIEELTSFLNNCVYRFKFNDQSLGAHVKRACHALSIDDERRTFAPVLWKDDPRIEQVWFAGVHANVGGGYEKHGMSLVSLDWMMTKAAESGLRFIQSDKDYYHNHQNVDDKLYDSRAGFGVYYRYRPRDIGEICTRHGVPVKVHVSAVERIARRTGSYAPGNIPRDCEIVGTEKLPAKVADEVKARIAKALVERRAVMDEVTPLIRARSRTHVLFFALSALAVVLYILVAADVLDELAGTMHWLTYVPVVITLGIVGVFWLAGAYFSHRIANVYAEFWHDLSTDLRKILHEESTE